jgi:hypothetical protein
MRSIPLPVASYNQPSRVPARLVNCYAQQSPGKGPVELIGAPGIASWWTPTAGEGRGLYVMRGSLYAVVGTTLYRVYSGGTADILGSLPGSGKLMFAGNGTDILFSNRYLFASGTVAAVADSDLPPVSAIGHVNSRVVYAESGTGRWGCSEVNDSGSYDPLNFATAEAAPDDIVTLIVDHQQVLLFGQTTTEIWWDSGQSGFPFERLSGGVLEFGALARFGVAQQDNSVYFLAHDRTIRRLAQQTAIRVSTHGVEEKLASYSRVDDCQAFAYTWNGHLMVAFRFPEAGATWVHDVTTGQWHERATYGASDWRVVDAAECYGRVFVQNSVTGAVGYLSDTTYTEFGGPLRREWTYAQVYDVNQRRVHSQLELVARTGDAPIGVVPYVLLEISDDGGNTWTAMPPRELGRTGEYGNVIRWNRLGQARDRVYRMSIENATVPVRVTDTTLVVG